jgi:hypothetical protein
MAQLHEERRKRLERSVIPFQEEEEEEEADEEDEEEEEEEEEEEVDTRCVVDIFCFFLFWHPKSAAWVSHVLCGFVWSF